MSRKKIKKKPHRGARREPVINKLRVMEKGMRDMTNLLKEQEFDSIEEANAFLQGIISSGGPLPSLKHTHSPLDKAQNLMYDAWESSGKRRVALARKALKISKDCADAYVLLAEETPSTLDEAKKLYEKGVKAGERAIGPQVFEDDVGHFWGILETRPYMRARAGLAQCLWALGKHQKAIKHYTEMLRLNPGDNQGIRYVLINCLLMEGSDKAVKKLLDQYKDDGTATWLYSRALWMFHREGASHKANALLKEALDSNRHVPAYMFGIKKLPARLPAYISHGDESEAIAYVADAVLAWHKSPHATEWFMGYVIDNGNFKLKTVQ